MEKSLIERKQESYLSALNTPIKPNDMDVEMEESDIMNFDMSDLAMRIESYKERKSANEDLNDENSKINAIFLIKNFVIYV